MKKNNEDKKTFKELWNNPVSNSLIKLGFYGIFFIIVYLFLFIGSSFSKQNNINTNKSSTTTTTTSYKVTYTKIKNDLVSNEQDIIYSINDYYLTGNISNNILNGTLEDNDNIYKIKYDGENIYKLKRDEEELNNDLLSDIKKDYLLPSKIIDIIDNPKVISTKSADEKIYSYNVEESAISVYIDNDKINKIIILDNGITYNLEFKEVGIYEE